MYGTPTMFVDILSLPDLKQYDMRTLTTGIMAGKALTFSKTCCVNTIINNIYTGAPCPKEIAKGAVKKLNMKDFMVG